MAVDMFLKMDKIKGESIDKTHKEAIDVMAWSWGMSQSGTFHSGSGGGAGKVNVQDISFTHYVDKASPVLMQAVCTGDHFDKAVLIVRKAGKTPLEYIKLTMEKVMITAVSTGGSGGEDRLTENVTINFAKFHFEYQIQDEKGTGKAGGECKFDIAANAEA